MLNAQGTSARLPGKIPVKGHAQVRPNLEPGFKARGLTTEGASRSSLWLVSASNTLWLMLSFKLISQLGYLTTPNFSLKMLEDFKPWLVGKLRRCRGSMSMRESLDLNA
jgi:hypothetical protein